MNFNGFDINERCLIEAKINFLDSKILTDDFKKEIAKILISDTTDKKLENVPNYKKRSAEPDDYILKNEELNIIIVFLESHTIGEKKFFMQFIIEDDDIVEAFICKTSKNAINKQTANIKTNSEIFSLDGIANIHIISFVRHKLEIDSDEEHKGELYLLILGESPVAMIINNQIPPFENAKKISVMNASYYMMLKLPIDESGELMESRVATFVNIFTGEEKTIDINTFNKELEMLGFNLNCDSDDDDYQEQLATMFESFYENADESEKTPENKKAMESIVNLYRNMSIETIDNEQKN